MKRQDEFLRHIAGRDHAGILAAIAERLPLLKPVAYENRDLGCGLSWEGHIICGDARSIQRVKNALHYESAYKPYPRLHRLEQTRRIAGEKLLLETMAALRAAPTPINLASIIDAIEAYLETRA